MKLDEIDRQILEAVQDAPLWKSRIQQEIAADRAVTTIGRRVKQLVNDGYLERTVIRGTETNRTLLDGFKLTESGREVIKENTGETSE